MQFQATCSKGNKKLTLTLTAENLDAARNILHGQGYSIIEIIEIDGKTLEGGNFFYFDAKVNGILQSGKIQSTDIFKSYKKLTEDLKYEVIYIYTTEGMPEEAKSLITAKVKDGYRLYKESLGEDMDAEADKKTQTEDQQELQEISGEVFKELEKYAKAIDSSIEKIQNLFLKYHDTITPDQKVKLENLENVLAQTKGTKNLGKMKNTVENGLRMIGETELALLKIGMTEEKKKFLEETNALLKQVGSKDRIETESDKQNTLNYKLSNLFSKVTTQKPQPKVEKEKKDTNSFIYFKNKRELDIYKKKLSELDIQILRAVFTFQFALVKKLFLKRRLISQNIEIIDNRINNRVISYTKIIHGFEYYIQGVVGFFQALSTLFLYALFFYSIAFIMLHTLDMLGIFSSSLEGKSLLFITLITLSTLLLSYIRGIKSLVFIFLGIFYIFYFLSLNF